MKNVVSSAVTRATASEGPVSLPRLANRASQTTDLVDSESDPNLWGAMNGTFPTPSAPRVSLSGGPMSGSPASATPSTPMETSTAATTAPSVPDGLPTEKGHGKTIVAVVAIAAVLGIGAFAFTRNVKPSAPESVQAKQSPPPTATTSQASPPPSLNAPAPPTVEVTVDIAAKPAAARIFVDGKRAPGNPHRITVARGDVMHEVRADADGYEPRSVTVAFDRDRSLDLSLVQKSAPAPAYTQAKPASTPKAKPAPPATTATVTTPTAGSPTGRGISEIDPSKSSTQPKQDKIDKIDKDVFTR
jgi:hypothetical protein